MNPEIDKYLSNIPKRQKEFGKLRKVILDCGLTEELKWGKPCYTFKGNNIVIIQGFKHYFAIMFFKGALLKDTKGILIKPGENSQAQRQIRFNSVGEITDMEKILKEYIYEAIEVEKSGLKVKLNKTSEFIIPEELEKKFDEMPDLKTAFNSLTPARQRAYLIYFSSPKQSKTRDSRIEKYIQQILKGKGLNDR